VLVDAGGVARWVLPGSSRLRRGGARGRDSEERRPRRVSRYNVVVSSPVSVRFPDSIAARLRRRSSRSGEATSGLVVRLVDEGMRMEDHPGIVFRDGPAGRRAGLAGGPDVWEVITVLRDFGSAGAASAVKRTAKWLALTEAQVRTAEGYYASFPDEVDERIAENADAAESAQRAASVRGRLYG